MKMTTTWFDPMTTAVNGPDSTDVILDTIIFRGNRGGKKSCGGGRGYCGRQIMSSRKSREVLRHCCNDAEWGSIVVAGASIERNAVLVLELLRREEMAGKDRKAYLFPPKVAFFTRSIVLIFSRLRRNLLPASTSSYPVGIGIEQYLFVTLSQQ